MLDLKKMLTKKEEGSATTVIMFIAMFAIIFVIITGYMLSSAKLMTHQHEIDDALADSALAAMIADDDYYYQTGESTGNYVIRYNNIDYSYDIYKEAFNFAISNGYEDFFSNIVFDETILYEVENGTVRIITFNDSGAKYINYGSVGDVRTPAGAIVDKSSIYAKVDFDIKTYFVTDIVQRKSRDIYCTFKIDRP